MRIICLRPETVVPTTPITRRHHPQGRYENHRPCLRWDFGFTCALCLVHEAHHAPETGRPGGVEGGGAMWIEHVVPQSASTRDRNRYSNCLWSCRACNRARDVIPGVGPEGQRLLDPTQAAWGAHFTLRMDHQRAEAFLDTPSDDRDGGYTQTTYDINAPLKSAMRYWRWKRVLTLVRYVEELAREIPLLEHLAQTLPVPQEAADAATRVVESRERLREHLSELDRRWRSVPADAPASCACGARCELPVLFQAGQVIVTYDIALTHVTVARR